MWQPPRRGIFTRLRRGGHELRVLGCSGTYPTATTPSSGICSKMAIRRSGWTAVRARSRRCSRRAGSPMWTRWWSRTFIRITASICTRSITRAASTLPRPSACPCTARRAPRSTSAWFLVGDGACKLGFIFDFRTIDEHSEVEVGSIRMRFMLTDHPIPTYAVRAVSATGDLTYSSDTGPGADLDDFAEGTDLLLCEASYQDGALGRRCICLRSRPVSSRSVAGCRPDAHPLLPDAPPRGLPARSGTRRPGTSRCISPDRRRLRRRHPSLALGGCDSGDEEPAHLLPHL